MSKKISETRGNANTPKITDIFNSKTPSSPQAIKRTSSQLSPANDDQQTKKQNTNTNMDEHVSSTNYIQLLDPLLSQFKSLRESVDNKVGSLEQAIQQQRKEVTDELHKIETSLIQHKEELTQQFKSDIQENKDNISRIVLENTSLKKENAALKERLNQIEQNQLKNNVIITGIPEQPWETYSTTKQRVIDTIASALRSNNDEERQANIAMAQNTEITYCTCIGRYRSGFCRPISVTFQRQEDKEILMSGKSNLLPGLYVNHEYPPYIKRNRDRLRPILRLAKNSQKYKDKCRLENDILILDGNRYTINDIATLPEEVAAYKSAQKVDDNSLAFHGEFSPFSNFHKSPFIWKQINFHCAEQFIQYQKAVTANDTIVAEEVLKCGTALEAKKLGYRIKGFNMQKWSTEGYDICHEGIKSKFVQNPLLLQMLKATGKKVIVEASTDKLWGTGVVLRDNQVLNPNRWHNVGWMSSILMDIRDNT